MQQLLLAYLDALLKPGKLASEQAHGLLIAASGVLVLGLAEAQHPSGPVSMHTHIHKACVQLGLVHMQHGLRAVAHAAHILDHAADIRHSLDHLGMGSAQPHLGVRLDVVQVVLLDRRIPEGFCGRLQHNAQAVGSHGLIPGILCCAARRQGVPVAGHFQVPLLELDRDVLTPAAQHRR